MSGCIVGKLRRLLVQTYYGTTGDTLVAENMVTHLGSNVNELSTGSGVK